MYNKILNSCKFYIRNDKEQTIDAGMMSKLELLLQKYKNTKSETIINLLRFDFKAYM
jgi:hypothetical protein